MIYALLLVLLGFAAIAVPLLVRQRMRAIQARDSDTRHRMILNSTKDGIVTLGPDGLITGLNPAIERLFGYPEEDLIGLSLIHI